MRNTYSPEFKAKVVREVLREEKTLSQVAAAHGIHHSSEQLVLDLQGLRDSHHLLHSAFRPIREAFDRKVFIILQNTLSASHEESIDLDQVRVIEPRRLNTLSAFIRRFFPVSVSIGGLAERFHARPNHQRKADN